MKPLRLIILFSLTLLYTQTSFSQEFSVTLFKTFSDYENNQGVELGDYYGYGLSSAGFSIITKKAGKKRTEKMNDYWGFRLDTSVFRVDRKTPYLVIKIMPEFVFYLHGSYNTTKLDAYDQVSAKTELQFSNYHISKDMASPIMPMGLGKAKKEFNEIGSVNPFMKCVVWKRSNEEVKDCFQEYYSEDVTFPPLPPTR
jgi:hypothetical protein